MGLSLPFPVKVCFKPGIGNTPGCRALTRQSLDRMCSRAKCTILHKISNDYLDAYVLSESSLFVYPRKASGRARASMREMRNYPLSLAPPFVSLLIKHQVFDAASVDRLLVLSRVPTAQKDACSLLYYSK